MDQKQFADRIWCTLLWEFTRYAEAMLSDTAAIDRLLATAQQVGVYPKGPRDVADFDTRTVRAIYAVAPVVFLDFLREHTEILDGPGTVEWAISMQGRYPEDELRKLFGADDTSAQ
jgi:hypothetical protein